MSIIVYINLFNLTERGDKIKKYKSFEKNVSQKFPNHKIKCVLALNKKELKNKLDNLLENNELISHMYIRAHGSSNVESTINIGYENEQLCLTNKCENANIIFSGIHNKFIDNAHIIFDSCELLSGDYDVVSMKVISIQQLLGLKNGTIYGNRTNGTFNKINGNITIVMIISLIIIMSPLYTLDNIGKYTLCLAFMIIMYQICDVCFVCNQGYTVTFEDSKLVNIVKRSYFVERYKIFKTTLI